MIKRLLVTLGILTLLISVTPAPTEAQSVLQDMFMRLDRVSEVYGQPGLQNDDTRGILLVRIARIASIFLSFLGLLMVILIIYGGFLWLTARGNEQQVDDAKHTIRSAIIGGIIILAAYTITGFVLYNVGNALR